MPPSKRPVRRVVVDDDDEAEAPAPSKRVRGGWNADESGDGDEVATAPASHGKSPLHGGWTEGQKQMDSTSSFASSFKPDEKTQVIRFLEDAPYASFRRHWIERQTKDGRQTRAWTCFKSFGDPCPLCEIGDKPQAVSAFNVAICGEDGQVILRSWDCGPRLFQTLKSYANDPKIMPLTKGYFAVSKTGKRSTTSYNVIPIRASALEEDYDVPVPDPDQFANLDLYTVDIVSIPSSEDIDELAAELADEYGV